MNPLIALMRQMVKTSACDEVQEIEHHFLELLAFSDFKEITSFLDDADANYYLELPLWSRILAYRLACLLEPSNVEIRRRAAAGLKVFGPDWDLQAEALQREAEDLSKPHRE